MPSQQKFAVFPRSRSLHLTRMLIFKLAMLNFNDQKSKLFDDFFRALILEDCSEETSSWKSSFPSFSVMHKLHHNSTRIWRNLWTAPWETSELKISKLSHLSTPAVFVLLYVAQQYPISQYNHILKGKEDFWRDFHTKSHASKANAAHEVNDNKLHFWVLTDMISATSIWYWKVLTK